MPIYVTNISQLLLKQKKTQNKRRNKNTRNYNDRNFCQASYQV